MAAATTVSNSKRFSAIACYPACLARPIHSKNPTKGLLFQATIDCPKVQLGLACLKVHDTLGPGWGERRDADGGTLMSLQSKLPRRSRTRPVALVWIALSSSQVLAQDNLFEHDRASFYVGAFVTERDTDTRLDSDSALGTVIDLERDLSLESSSTVGRFGGELWFKPRQRLDFSVFDLSRSASRRIDETINFGDQTFTIDTPVNSTFDFTIVKADYTFAAVSRPKGFLGVTGGLYIAQFKLGIDSPALGAAESEDLTAPLPVIGLRGEYEITDRVSLIGAAQWFRLETGDAGGRLRDVYIGADYRFGRHIASGVAYNDVGMAIRAKEPGGLQGQLDWSYDGWLVYVKAGFGSDR